MGLVFTSIFKYLLKFCTTFYNYQDIIFTVTAHVCTTICSLSWHIDHPPHTPMLLLLHLISSYQKGKLSVIKQVGKLQEEHDGIVCDQLQKALVESKPQSVLNCNKSRELLQQSIFTLIELE